MAATAWRTGSLPDVTQIRRGADRREQRARGHHLPGACARRLFPRQAFPAPRHGTGQDTRALARAYLAIAAPANRRLDVEVDRFTDEAHHDLAAAESALRAEAATERAFDRDLAKIGFPPAIAATARALISVNEIRAWMAERQARAGSISVLLAMAAAHKAADAQVEAQVRVIRAQLGLPPPPTS